MQRVRKFLIVKDAAPVGSKLSQATVSNAIHCEGWHQTWDTAIGLLGPKDVDNQLENSSEVAIADAAVALQVIAIFSPRNLESVEGESAATKWRSVRITTGEGWWCNLNYSDYGWGWVSGAKREVPFRLRFLERQAEANPDSLLSRVRAWFIEVRDWFYGHDKKIL